MEKNICWIHCRVQKRCSSSLLNFQERTLKEVADHLGLHVRGVSKEVSEGKFLTSREITVLFNLVVNEKIDYILVYSKRRISIYDDIYEEFEMLCAVHHVKILTLDNLTDSLNDFPPFIGF